MINVAGLKKFNYCFKESRHVSCEEVGIAFQILKTGRKQGGHCLHARSAKTKPTTTQT